jgi:hypothetical protein
MEGHLQRGQGRPPGLVGSVAAAIEAAVDARLRAEGHAPLPASGAAARDRRLRLLAAADGAVGRRGGRGRSR